MGNGASVEMTEHKWEAIKGFDSRYAFWKCMGCGLCRAVGKGDGGVWYSMQVISSRGWISSHERRTCEEVIMETVLK